MSATLTAPGSVAAAKILPVSNSASTADKGDPGPGFSFCRFYVSLISYPAESIPTLLAENGKLASQRSCPYRLAEFCNGISTLKSRF